MVLRSMLHASMSTQAASTIALAAESASAACSREARESGLRLALRGSENSGIPSKVDLVVAHPEAEDLQLLWKGEGEEGRLE